MLSPLLRPRACQAFSSSSETALFAKKAAKAKKIQVRLLKPVSGTGQKGDVVQVTPAFFQNKLRPTHLAEIITDQEVQEMESERAAAENEERQRASALKDELLEMTISIKRKVGPDGQLFGGIGPKVIMDELQNVVNDDFLKQKSVKITAIMDGDGKKMRDDIKHVGEFGVEIVLSKGISSEFNISVQPEE